MTANADGDPAAKEFKSSSTVGRCNVMCPDVALLTAQTGTFLRS
jgi:hypothetical protein